MNSHNPVLSDCDYEVFGSRANPVGTLTSEIVIYFVPPVNHPYMDNSMDPVLFSETEKKTRTDLGGAVLHQ